MDNTTKTIVTAALYANPNFGTTGAPALVGLANTRHEHGRKIALPVEATATIERRYGAPYYRLNVGGLPGSMSRVRSTGDRPDFEGAIGLDLEFAIVAWERVGGDSERYLWVEVLG